MNKPQETNDYIIKTVSEQNRKRRSEINAVSGTGMNCGPEELFVNADGLLEMIKQKIGEMNKMLAIKDTPKIERMYMFKHRTKLINCQQEIKNLILKDKATPEAVNRVLSQMRSK